MSIEFERYKRNYCPKGHQQVILINAIQLPKEKSRDLWSRVKTKQSALQIPNTEILVWNKLNSFK
jgi:hypothetical protein